MFWHWNNILMINWIVINRTVLTFKLCTSDKLNFLKMGQIELIFVIMLNWIFLNRTAYMHKNGFGIKYSTMVYMVKKQTKPNLLPKNQTPAPQATLLENLFFLWMSEWRACTGLQNSSGNSSWSQQFYYQWSPNHAIFFWASEDRANYNYYHRTVTFIFHSFLSSPARSKYLHIFSLLLFF